MNASDQSFASAEAGFLRDLRTDTFLRRYLTRPKREELAAALPSPLECEDRAENTGSREVTNQARRGNHAA